MRELEGTAYVAVCDNHFRELFVRLHMQFINNERQHVRPIELEGRWYSHDDAWETGLKLIATNQNGDKLVIDQRWDNTFLREATLGELVLSDVNLTKLRLFG